MLDPLELLGVEAGVVGTVVVVVVVAVEVGLDLGTTMTAGRVVVDWAGAVGGGRGFVGGFVGDGAAVVGAGTVVRAGRVALVVGAATASVVGEGPGAATASVVGEGAGAAVGPVAIGASGRGADGLELPEPHADSAAVPSTTTASQRVHVRRAVAS